MQTFRDNVIVKFPEQEEVTKNGIVLPFMVKDGHRVGDVIAVGEGRYNEKTGRTIPLTVKVGDKVIVNIGTGITLEKDVVLLREEDIFGIVDDRQ